MNMHKKNVSWLIAIIVSIKTCVAFFEFPMFNVTSILPQVPTIVTKPTQYLYKIPSLLDFSLDDANKNVKPLLQPVSMIKTVNPFNLLTNFFENSDDSLRGQSQSHTLKSEPWQNEHSSSNNPFYIREKLFNSIPPYSMSSPELHTESDLSFAQIENLNNIKTNENKLVGPPKYTFSSMTKNDIEQHMISLNYFLQVLENLEHKFYQASFQKLLSISPPERQENGISFAQSGLFLYLELMALCTESDEETVNQIKQALGLRTTCAGQIEILKNVMHSLPTSSEFVKFRWSSRLVLNPRINISDEFLRITAPVLHIILDYLHETEDAKEITKRLNNMVEIDSGGAMRHTFEEDELSNGICAVWLTTLYLRARWRSAPTVLNGSRLFYDGDAPPRSVNMIRINDIMRYAYLIEWNAEAIEIQYAHSELTLLIILPRERSLKKLATWVSSVNLQTIYDKMLTKRLAVLLPIYTLRMTLLLPGKLRTMGISRLVNTNAGNGCDSLKLSHGIQRIMFWAEAGRNAFKDDGIEWDEAPEFEMILDRPYIYFVRWRNLTLLNGHFVL